MQLHLQGKLHQGYLKIREKLKVLKDKRNDDRRRGYERRRKSRSRSRERLRREAKNMLKEEAQSFFYYSSNKYGQASNMPKLGFGNDSQRIKLS